MARIDRNQREGPLQAPTDHPHGLDEVTVRLRIRVRQEMGDHLGVGLTRHRDAEFIAQFRVILDDAVVDHRDLLITADMWMGIAIGRAPVGGPSSVADARRRRR